jgi:hypothetical protein
MDLNNFIHKVLINIKQGIADANKEIAEKNNKQTEPSQFVINGGASKVISFDVAVTTMNEIEKTGDGSIKVFSVSLGGSKNTSELQQTVSRIKFEVQISQTIY